MPTLYYFNPGHETAILNGSPYYTPPTSMIQMQQDLMYLPAWLGEPEDFVLLSSLLPQSFLEQLQSNGIITSKQITAELLDKNVSHIYAKPWGVSPQSIHFFEKLKLKYQIDIYIRECDTRLKDLSGRHTARECLANLCECIPEISSSLIPEFFTNLDLVEKHVARCNYQLLAKAPFSSSGRGLLWLPVGKLTRVEQQILQGMLNKQGCLSLEKAQKRILDFAMEFSISDKNIVYFEGYSLFETSEKGNYLGNYLGSQDSITEKLESYVSSEILEEIQKHLIQLLKTKFEGIYEGTIGVDMMIYLDDYEYKLHPCIEINVRDNMGILSTKIYENHLHPDSVGSFYLDFNSKDGELLNLDSKMKAEYPLKVTEGRIISGYLSLCPITEQTKYRAYILVE